jgi:Lrp/AsnC family transcriptional regulator, leucine-responsive regulatory protein
MDTIDAKALRVLQATGRESWAALGETLGMTGPAAADRVRRLEERGVIRGYTAVVDPQAVGVGLAAFVAVSLERPKDRARFLALVASLPEIQDCHHVAGDDDFLLKIRCRDTADLERLLTHELKGLTGVARTRTTVVLSTVKETLVVPIPAGPTINRPR